MTQEGRLKELERKVAALEELVRMYEHVLITTPPVIGPELPPEEDNIPGIWQDTTGIDLPKVIFRNHD